MAVEFPQNPVLDETFEAAGILYSWDGTRWVSAYSPSIDFTGATGPLGATGATGPTTDQVFVTESDDPNVDFSIPFVKNGAPSGITTVYRDSSGIIFNPSTNTLGIQNASIQFISSALRTSNDTVTTFIDGLGGIGKSGFLVNGIYSTFTSSGAGQGSIQFTTNVANFSQTLLEVGVHCATTGNCVNNQYKLFRKVGSEGFDVFNWSNNQYAYPSPVDSLVVDSGVVFDDPLIGLYTQRSSTNSTVFGVGVYSKQNGNYDFDVRIKISRLGITDVI